MHFKAGADHENANSSGTRRTGSNHNFFNCTGQPNGKSCCQLHHHARRRRPDRSLRGVSDQRRAHRGETEPGTVLWFALQADDTLAIFDIFADEDARDAHFSGAVVAALNQNADTLVNGGWEDGVVANINNSDVLSAKAPVDLYTATTATYIKLEAASGKGPELAALLTAAGPIVGDTEPKTLFWAALQIDENNFAIFDIFADNSGREAHFAGQVAGLLNERLQNWSQADGTTVWWLTSAISTSSLPSNLELL